MSNNGKNLTLKGGGQVHLETLGLGCAAFQGKLSQALGEIKGINRGLG